MCNVILNIWYVTIIYVDCHIISIEIPKVMVNLNVTVIDWCIPELKLKTGLLLFHTHIPIDDWKFLFLNSQKNGELNIY